MTSNKKKALAAGGVGIVLAGWLGASIHAGSVAERELRAFAARPSSETGVRVRNLQHSGGLFSSKGSFGVEIVDQCGGDGPPAALELEYSLAHLILPTAPIRVEWSAKPSGEIAAALAEVFGPSLKLEGKGDVSFGGEFRSAMALPELAVEADGGKLTIAPSSGRLAFGKTALAVSWGIERVLARGNGEAFELGRIALDLDLKNRYLGTGTTSLSIDKISTSHGSAEGFRHATEVVEEGDRLHTRLTESLRAVAFGGETAKDLSLEVAIRDVDKQSVETLSRLVGDTCGFQNMTADEEQSFRKALRTLLVQGFSIGVPKLAGTVGNGSLEGRLTLEARKAASPTAPISLASMFRSSGELLVRGEALAGDKKQQALALGFTLQKDGSLKGSFEYVDGILRTNGRIFDGSAVLAGLGNADQAINAFLDGGGPLARRAPAAVPPMMPQPVQEEEDAPEVAAAPAAAVPVAAPAVAAPAVAVVPPPVPASPAQPAGTTACDSTRQCLGEALGAAAGEDAGRVFAIAARIDELGKPALGNRAIARKLNTEGLEALKAEDPARAAELFRKGLAENPRDVEIAGNLGFALVKAGKAEDAVGVLTAALALDPRRSSTWTPLAEALALVGRKDEGQAALWVAYQWSGNREKSLAFYSDRVEKEKAARPALSELYASVLGWVAEGRRPRLASLMAG
jgi:tetratricopeptide (TPR) repeat protein